MAGFCAVHRASASFPFGHHFEALDAAGFSPPVEEPLTRSFDERSHSYLGYLLRINGTMNGADSEFQVGVGPEAQAKQQLRIGDSIEGVGLRVRDPQLEMADIYRVSKLKVLRRGEESDSSAP